MSTNKDRIEKLELDMQKLSDDSAKRFESLEKSLENIARVGETRHSSWNGQHRSHQGEGSYIRPLKMDFPRFSGEEPIIWLDRVAQYFELQQTPEEQEVMLAAFYLEGEANQWWQWLKKVYAQDTKPVVLMNFEQDLLARFRPIDYEDFDEVLSHIEQKGTILEYQWEFECLANRVEGWP
ncbi:hypothetical protein Pint_33769 [Pistacia integerrima]|uniref:Uncharacterized protein n=1 Tax=Pistacia integerrima TaxID=434235 RepID=A0ACC0X3X2_9ROSI|nr:hypothetical protein Pint_33769 [Pistacia integerrima]